MESNSHRSQKIRSSSQSVAASTLWNETENKNTFCQEWQAHQVYLSHCCLKWMNSNPIDAEEVLSQAMLKAWNEWQNYENKIKYPKAWLTQIVHNFCLDLHRKRKRNALKIENIDQIKIENYPAIYSNLEFNEPNIIDLEFQEYIHHKIDSLPPRLRETFVLYHCQNKSYQEIAKLLVFSEENVRKSVRKACRILQKHLIKYLAGEDDTPLNSLSPSFNLKIPLAENSSDESNWQSLIPTKTLDEEISYQVTLLCLESLSNHLYSSVNSLAWR